MAVALVVVSGPASPVGPAADAHGRRYLDPVFARVDVTRDVVYATVPGADGVPVELKADVYEGRGDTDTARRAVVLVHGGGFTKGSKADLGQEGVELARRGYVAVAVDYRLRPAPTMTWCEAAPDGPQCDPRLVAAMTDAAADVGSAVDAIRRMSAGMGVDPGAIAVYGYSAGAITALHLAHRTLPGTGGAPAQTPPIQAAVSLAGAIAPADVSAGAAPALMVHGTEDTVVAYSAAVAAQAAASAHGDDARLVSIPGAGHGFDAAQAAAAAKAALAFLDEVLQPGAAHASTPAPAAPAGAVSPGARG
ncbi:MAG: alpha/beta hydrolase [Acidimicrobiia bacterium]|nr:alpha/beta hydrolase [Acidimicrobiia bacterium]